MALSTPSNWSASAYQQEKISAEGQKYPTPAPTHLLHLPCQPLLPLRQCVALPLEHLGTLGGVLCCLRGGEREVDVEAEVEGDFGCVAAGWVSDTGYARKYLKRRRGGQVCSIQLADIIIGRLPSSDTLDTWPSRAERSCRGTLPQTALAITRATVPSAQHSSRAKTSIAISMSRALKTLGRKNRFLVSAAI